MSLRLLGRVLVFGSLLTLAAGLATLRWGGYLLVAPEPLPPRADVLVVLAGSVEGQEVRWREAFRLLREGRADHVLLSAPETMYLGQWVPDMTLRYVEHKFGAAAGTRVIICSRKADSTEEEVRALRQCLEKNGWRSVVVVTSNYHTRRTKLIWREVCADASPPFSVVVHGIPDGDFQVDGWWRKRRYAKTFLEESTKLVWSYVFE